MNLPDSNGGALSHAIQVAERAQGHRSLRASDKRSFGLFRGLIVNGREITLLANSSKVTPRPRS